MRPCHAAALALVGWYLIVPPITNDPGSVSRTYGPAQACYPWAPAWQRPLFAWIPYLPFDSAAACQAAKKRLSDKAHADVAGITLDVDRVGCGDSTPAQHSAGQRMAGDLAELAGRCIASEDSRLKPN